MLHPLLDTKEISKRYDIIEELINNERYKKYETELVVIQDLERLHRKMGLNMLQPADFGTIDFSYEFVRANDGGFGCII